MKALIVRLSSIGDVVHALPVLPALRRQGWDVDWLVEPAARPLLEGHPLLRQLHVAPPARAFRPGAAWRIRTELRRSRYDVVLDLQGLWKSAGWGRLARGHRLLGYSRRWRREPASAILLSQAVELPPDVRHVIDEHLGLLRPLGIEAVGSREFVLPPFPAAARAIEAALAQAALAEFVILNPAGGWPEKLWPPDAYGALARELREHGLASLVTWGPGEEALADRVVAASEGAAQRCFPTNLAELVELARRCRLFVAGDTGPLHLAAAVGAPVVGIYGPTDAARNGPFSPADEVVVQPGPPDPRRRGRYRVSERDMAGLAPTAVVAAALRRLGRRGAPAACAV